MTFSLLLSQGGILSAQSERERLIDSLANPSLSATGAVLKFDTCVLDAGLIPEEGGAREYEFVWTNAGDVPVTVLKVSTSCGCAVPEYDRKTVSPGQKGSLKIRYYPKGHPGEFSLRILVYTDQSVPKPAVRLLLNGTVRPAAVPTWRYLHQMGNIFLKQKEVVFSDDAKSVARISCLNGGDSPLTVGAEKDLLPPYLEFRCEPETIPAGEEAELVIAFDPAAVPMRLLNVVPVILSGIDLPPSQRTLRVIFRDTDTVMDRHESPDSMDY